MTGKDYKHIRFRNYMTQEYAASMVGISRFTLSGYESDKVRIPLIVSLRLNKLYNLTEAEVDGFMMK